MNSKLFSLSEILKAKLLPLKSGKGITDWIKSVRIKEVEWY
jgi:hypothetical protein